MQNYISRNGHKRLSKATITIILTIALIVIAPNTAFSSEEISLLDGSSVYGYRTLDIPQNLRRDDCDKYAFSNQSYTPLKDGLYFAADKAEFLIKNNCLFPIVGKTLLQDKREIYFFEEDTFNTEGNLAYFCQATICTQVPDGEYKLNSLQKFKIQNGRIDNYGFFDGEGIGYEDKN